VANGLLKPSDIPALCDIGLLFGGLALFYAAILLVRNSLSGVLIVFLSQIGFLGGGLYGDHQIPASTTWEHMRSVATSTGIGIAIGASIALFVVLIMGAWRVGKWTVKAEPKAAGRGAQPNASGKPHSSPQVGNSTHFFLRSQPTLGLDRVQIQRFLQRHRN